MLLDVQRATAYSNHNQHSNSSLIRSTQFASRRNRFPPVDSSRQEPLFEPGGFSSPCIWRWSRSNLREGPRLRKRLHGFRAFPVEERKLTASSAESVRLVVTLTKAGGTLRYTQEQPSASSRNITNKVSLYPIFFPLYLAQHLSKNCELGRSLGSRDGEQEQ